MFVHAGTSRYVWLFRSTIHETGLQGWIFPVAGREIQQKNPPPTPSRDAWSMQQLCRRNYVVSSSEFDIAEISKPKQREEKSFINNVITLLDSMEPQLFHVEVLSVYAADKTCSVTLTGPVQRLLFICKTLLAFVYFQKQKKGNQTSTCQRCIKHPHFPPFKHCAPF